VFEKEGVLCDKQEMKKTVAKCENVTQVVSGARSYDDEDRKKKVLTPARFWTEMSISKRWRNAADFRLSDFPNARSAQRQFGVATCCDWRSYDLSSAGVF
jgi:hypothetical protein